MTSTIERAIELAQSGRFHSVDEIRKKLKSEGFDGVQAHVAGSLAKQLQTLIKEARKRTSA